MCQFLFCQVNWKFYVIFKLHFMFCYHAAGYVSVLSIVETDNEIDATTVQALKGLPDFYHFLNSNTDIVPLNDRDLAIIQHFLGLGPKIGASLVKFDENDRIVVIEDPLKGIEGNIIKVDRRKKHTKILIDFHGSFHTMDLSFEDISRS